MAVGAGPAAPRIPWGRPAQSSAPPPPPPRSGRCDLHWLGGRARESAFRIRPQETLLRVRRPKPRRSELLSRSRFASFPKVLDERRCRWWRVVNHTLRFAPNCLSLGNLAGPWARPEPWPGPGVGVLGKDSGSWAQTGSGGALPPRGPAAPPPAARPSPLLAAPLPCGAAGVCVPSSVPRAWPCLCVAGALTAVAATECQENRRYLTSDAAIHSLNVLPGTDVKWGGNRKGWAREQKEEVVHTPKDPLLLQASWELPGGPREKGNRSARGGSGLLGGRSGWGGGVLGCDPQPRRRHLVSGGPVR